MKEEHRMSDRTEPNSNEVMDSEPVAPLIDSWVRVNRRGRSRNRPGAKVVGVGIKVVYVKPIGHGHVETVPLKDVREWKAANEREKARRNCHPKKKRH